MSSPSSVTTDTPGAAARSHWVGEYFRAVGGEIERRVGAGEVESETFADAATAVLKQLAPPRGVDAAAMAEWMVAERSLPRQVNFHTGFGQPPLVVYLGPTFYLEVLFWFPSRTSVHGHGFSGAFRVLDGYSVQATYEFTAREVWDEALKIGDLKPRGLELLLPGDVCDIRAKEAFVHSVVHMGYPSLTLVARTFGETAIIQLSYYRSGVAFSPFRRRQELTRQRDVLFVYARRDAAAAAKLFREFLANQDGFGRFLSCYLLADRDQSPLGAEVLDWAGGQWPRMVELVRRVVEEDQRKDRVYRHLAQLPDSRAQLLAALSEMFGTKEEAWARLAEFFPGAAPEATLAKWAELVPTLPKVPAGR